MYFQSSNESNETTSSHAAPFSRWKRAVLSVCAVIFLFTVGTSCDSSTGSDAAKGSIVGFVKTSDQWTRSIDEKEGITVSLEGTSISDRTNAAGRFQLEDVKAGIYNLTFEKSGFGTMRIPAFSFVGNGQAFVKPGDYVQLSKIPDFTTTIDTIYTDAAYDGETTVDVEGSISAAVPRDGLGKVVTFYSTSEDVSAGPSSYDVFSYRLIGGGNSEYSNQAYLDQFAAPGETIYVRSYSASGINARYADPETNNMMFGSLGDSTETKQFVVPESEGNSNNRARKSKSDIQGWIHFGDKTIAIPKDVTNEKLRAIQQEISSKLRQVARSGDK